MSRSVAEFRRIYGSEARVQWVKDQPCIACLVAYGDDSTPSENAHIESGGKGRKADSDKIAPICFVHHKLLHRLGRQSFESQFGFSLAEAAAITERKWEAYNDAG